MVTNQRIVRISSVRETQVLIVSLFTNLSTQFRSYSYASITAFEKLVQRRCKSGKLSVTEALGYSNSMLEMEHMPSVWTLNLFFGSLSNMNQFSTVVSMYTHLKRSHSVDFDPNVDTLNIVVKCLCRSGNVKSGFSILGTMLKSGIRHDPQTLNTLLDGLFKEGSMVSAMELFDRIKTETSWCSEVTYATVINWFCKSREPKKALELLQKMVDGGGTKPQACCFNSVVDCLCKDGLIQEAVALFQKMIGCGIRPNVVSYNSLIQGLSFSGKWKEVAQILKDMKGHGVAPDIVTVNTILDARFKEGNTIAALHLVGVMAKKRVLPDALSSSSFLSGLCPNARPEEAKILCDGMENVGIVADTHTIGIVLNGLTAGFMMLEAQNLFEIIVDRGQVGTVTFTTMIKGYCLQGEMDKARGMLAQMEIYAVFPNIITYSILAKGYLKVGRVDEALKILKEMILKGLRPDKVTRRILKMIHAYKHGMRK